MKSSRRDFLDHRRQGTAARGHPAGFPAIVPSSVFGAASPSNRINVGAIGTGRISRGHDLPGIWQHDIARIMAVCDLDSQRVEDAATLVNDYYAKKTGKPYDGVTAYATLPRAARQQGRRRRRHQHAGSLARAHRDRRGGGGQGRLPAEAGLADDRRGPRPQRRRPALRPHLPDRQPAALDGAVPLRRRARAQRPHRPAEDGGGRPARRSVGRRRAGDAGARKNLNYDMWLGLDAGRVLHREARASADRLRPSGLAALRAVRRRHDHGLGRAPHRQRALGHGHRAHRARWRSGARRSSRRRACGTSTGRFKTEALYANGVQHDRERRLPERHQVHRHRTAGSSCRAATRRSRPAIRWRS